MEEIRLILQDIHARLGRLEDLVGQISDRVGETQADISSLKASLDGPAKIRDRVDRLESWRDKILGVVALVSLLAGSSLVASIFLRIF